MRAGYCVRKVRAAQSRITANGHPWLTPYAWCYRLIYNTRHRKDFMVRTARGLDSDDAYAAAKEELEFFKEMGLL